MRPIHGSAEWVRDVAAAMGDLHNALSGQTEESGQIERHKARLEEWQDVERAARIKLAGLGVNTERV